MTVAQVRAVLAASAASGRPATFAGRRLVDLNLDGLDFRKANFRGADLLETSFRNANLSGSFFDGANMSAVKLGTSTCAGQISRVPRAISSRPAAIFQQQI